MAFPTVTLFAALVLATSAAGAAAETRTGPAKVPPAAKSVQSARPSKVPTAPVRPHQPVQDQSYLFLGGPQEGKGLPDYITSGTKHSNQPWFMTTYDKLGNWP